MAKFQQHKDSRIITSELLKYANDADLDNLQKTLQLFIKLYRAHSAEKLEKKIKNLANTLMIRY